ncbi:hypothetical protein L4D18_21790 [Vibrio campbellii]
MDNQPRRRSKKQEEYDKKQGKARRRIEIMQELKRLGLDPSKDVYLLMSS